MSKNKTKKVLAKAMKKKRKLKICTEQIVVSSL